MRGIIGAHRTRGKLQRSNEKSAVRGGRRTRRAEPRDLPRGERTPLAWTAPAEVDRPERHASQQDDAVAQGVAVALHLVLPPFTERERKARRGPRPAPQKLHRERHGRPVVEHDPAAPVRKVASVHAPRDVGLVDTRHRVARMQQVLRERAVVGEEQRALHVGVEPPDRIEARVAGHEVGHHGAPLRIADGGDVSAGFVEEEVAQRFTARQRRAVDGDEVDVGVGQRRQLAGDDPVDRDATVPDEPVSPPP